MAVFSLLALVMLTVSHASVERINDAFKLDLVGKKVSQSSTVKDGTAERAIDGDLTQAFWPDRMCTFTRRGNNWWQVELGETYDVKYVKVYNRGDCCGSRLNGFTIKVGDHVCANNMKISQGEAKLVWCHKGSVGKNVRIEVHDILHLCEVEVYVAKQTPKPKLVKFNPIRPILTLVTDAPTLQHGIRFPSRAPTKVTTSFPSATPTRSPTATPTRSPVSAPTMSPVSNQFEYFKDFRCHCISAVKEGEEMCKGCGGKFKKGKTTKRGQQTKSKCKFNLKNEGSFNCSKLKLEYLCQGTGCKWARGKCSGSPDFKEPKSKSNKCD